jgi:hypothetical protein
MRNLFYLLLLVSTIVGAKEYSIDSGNWESITTWSKNLQPTTEDTILIKQNHSVTISKPNTSHATDVVIIIEKGASLVFSGKLSLTEDSQIISNGGNLISLGGGNSDKIRIGGIAVWSGNIGDYSGNFIIDNEGILPVQWGVVQAKYIGDDIRVSWSTITEKENSHFIIQYSYDLSYWYNAGEVEGSGYSYNEVNYSKTISVQGATTIYIRIAQFDYNGDSDFSKVVSVNKYNKSTSIAYYVDLNGRKGVGKPRGFSIAVYLDGSREKIFER